MFKIRERKHQARGSKSVTLEKQEKSSTCAECGKSYSEPIELTVRDKDSLETYQACPHCFSRVKVPGKIKKRPDGAAPSTPEKAVKVLKETEKKTKKEIEEAIETKIETETEEDVQKDVEKDVGKEKPVGCEHFLGYLKKRPKGSPVPDECLTCASVMKCMGLA